MIRLSSLTNPSTLCMQLMSTCYWREHFLKRSEATFSNKAEMKDVLNQHWSGQRSSSSNANEQSDDISRKIPFISFMTVNLQPPPTGRRGTSIHGCSARTRLDVFRLPFTAQTACVCVCVLSLTETAGDIGDSRWWALIQNHEKAKSPRSMKTAPSINKDERRFLSAATGKHFIPHLLTDPSPYRHTVTFYCVWVSQLLFAEVERGWWCSYLSVSLGSSRRRHD